MIFPSEVSSGTRDTDASLSFLIQVIGHCVSFVHFAYGSRPSYQDKLPEKARRGLKALLEKPFLGRLKYGQLMIINNHETKVHLVPTYLM